MSDSVAGLTNSQFLLWTGQQLHPDAPLYNMALAFELGGRIEPYDLERAVGALLERSDALRSVIEPAGDAPRQRVLAQPAARLEHVDLARSGDPDAALRAWIGERVGRRFDLHRSLLDTALVRLAPDRWVWYLNQHHLVTDGWSAALVYRRIAELYARARAGSLAEARNWPQYTAYVEHERRFRSSALFERVRAHWRRKLERPLVPVPLYGIRAATHGTRTERVTRAIDDDASLRLRAVASAHGGRALSPHTSQYNLFATALFAYLHRVSGERRIAIGTPSHNRATAAFKETIGVFIEVLPYVIEVDEADTFRSLLARVQSETADFLRYAQPGTSTPEVNRSFSVLLNYIHASFPAFDGVPVRSEWIHAGHGDSAHALRLQVHDFDESGRFILHFDFNQALFGAVAREAAADHFLRVLHALLADIDRPVREVPLMAEPERLITAGPSAGARPAEAASASGATVVDLFRAQATKTPDAVAVACGDRQLTYAELNDRASAIAHDLRALGVGPDVFVGVCMERSIEAVVGILGVLFAGGAYLPLSPNDPPERLASLVHDAGARVLLTRSTKGARVLVPEGVQEIALDAAARAGDGQGAAGSAGDPPARAHAAYLLYTSGSTGRPKGVIVEHGSLANYVAWARDFYLRGDALDFPLFTSLSFDLTVTSLFVPLVSGGRVVVYGGESGVPALLRVLEEDAVDIIKLTPSHLALLRARDLRGRRVRALIVGGEDLRTEQAGSALAALGEVEIYNEYGPTEATVGCMIHRFDAERDVGASVPIGVAAAGAGIRLLDAGLHPVPDGVIGEIHVAGPGVARGYLNRPELTAERFVPDPFSPGARMYRTGDLARRRGDGIIEYLGRADEQVKVLGARVEPAEVEAALLAHAGVEACVVDVVRGARPASDALVFCARCGLPSNYPGARYDAEGICHLCRAFDGYRDRVRRYFRGMDDLRAVFEAARARKRGEHDCVMLLSGGKDSTYALYQLVGLGLRVLAFTLDNGYLSAQAKENIRRVTGALGVEHIFGTTPAMNAIFVDSLQRHSNVCNGCFKTIYTLGARLARERGIPIVVTGLSRGQFFETRLTEELFRDESVDVERIDQVILEARKAYHRADDAVAKLLETHEFRDDAFFEDVRFVDFYRYCDVGLDEMLAFLERHVPWIRPSDTGRSTNCLINQAGIFVHTRERGFHNYAFPYSWDVRMGHKTRTAALHELNDDLDAGAVHEILKEIGYAAWSTADRPELRLAAYYVARADVTAAELRAHLAARLPAYMVPTHFVPLEKLPLTPNGKIDRAALPAPSARRAEAESTWVAPRSPVEQRIAAIWEELLGTGRVGVADEFLDLGGNSLLAIRIISRVNQAFGVDLALRSAFEASTVARLARLVEDAVLAQVAALPDDEVARLTGNAS